MNNTVTLLNHGLADRTATHLDDSEEHVVAVAAAVVEALGEGEVEGGLLVEADDALEGGV